MQKIHELDQMIESLKKKKEHLLLKRAQLLHRHLTKLMGEDFSMEILLGMVLSQWSNASPAQKEEWQQAGCTFLAGRSKSKPSSGHLEGYSKDKSKNPATRVNHQLNQAQIEIHASEMDAINIASQRS